MAVDHGGQLLQWPGGQGQVAAGHLEDLVSGALYVAVSGRAADVSHPVAWQSKGNLFTSSIIGLKFAFPVGEKGENWLHALPTISSKYSRIMLVFEYLTGSLKTWSVVLCMLLSLVEQEMFFILVHGNHKVTY